MILGVAFVWFTTHFGGGFASGAQIYSYYVRWAWLPQLHLRQAERL